MSLGYKKRKKALGRGARLKRTKSTYTTEYQLIPPRKRARMNSIRRRIAQTKRIHGKIAAAKMQTVLDRLAKSPWRSFLRQGETINGSFS